MSQITRLLREERGASMVEYSLLLGVITAAAVGTIATVGGKVSTSWTAVDTAWTP